MDELTRAIYAHFITDGQLPRISNGLVFGLAKRRKKFPYYRYNIIDNQLERLMGGKVNEGVIIQFDAFSANTSSDEIIVMATALKRRFDQSTFSIAAHSNVSFLRMPGEQFIPEQKMTPNSEFGWHYVVDFQGRYHEING